MTVLWHNKRQSSYLAKAWILSAGRCQSSTFPQVQGLSYFLLSYIRARNFLSNSLVPSDKYNVYFACPNHKTTCPKIGNHNNTTKQLDYELKISIA